MTTKPFGVRQKSTGLWLHIRRFDDNDQPLLTADPAEAWVSFKEQAVSQAGFLLPDGDWVAVEHPTFDYAIVKAWSDRKMSRHEAMDKLGIDWYGTLLDLLGIFDLPYPLPPKEIIDAQVHGALVMFAKASGFSDTRRATIRRDGKLFVAYIEQDGKLDATESDSDPVALAQKLIDQNVYIGFVICEDKLVTGTVKSEMRRLMDTRPSTPKRDAE